MSVYGRVLVAAAMGSALIAGALASGQNSGELRFEVSFAPDVHSEAVTGRVFVMLSPDPVPLPFLEIGRTGIPFFGADVEGLRVREPERVRDERGGVGHDLVGGRRGDEDEVDLLERDAGAVERLLAGVDREVGEALAGPCVAALADAGARLDPGVVDAKPAGDLRVGHDALRQRDADGGDLLARRCR